MPRVCSPKTNKQTNKKTHGLPQLEWNGTSLSCRIKYTWSRPLLSLWFHLLPSSSYTLCFWLPSSLIVFIHPRHIPQGSWICYFLCQEHRKLHSPCPHFIQVSIQKSLNQKVLPSWYRICLHYSLHPQFPHFFFKHLEQHDVLSLFICVLSALYTWVQAPFQESRTLAIFVFCCVPRGSGVWYVSLKI